MAELTAAQFADFFRAVHGQEVFDWQRRLATEILEGPGWPDVIRVPTGCGKTSTLDLALFEMAGQTTNKSEECTATRRVCFVIDRRLVVDEVTQHALRLHNAIMSATQGRHDEPILKEVAKRLSWLAVDAEQPLRTVRLRGGVYRDDAWAADPLTPTILISTVDQIGSRMLFRGYGVGLRSRPVHAGLLAFDTRILLDEAHLSKAFAETLAHIREYQGWAEEPPLPVSRHVSVVWLSATARDGGKPFELVNVERDDPRLKPRLDATKPAELIDVKVDSIPQTVRKQQPSKARQLEQENREKLVKHLVQQARRVAGVSEDGTANRVSLPRVVGVVVNRVATARSVFDRLVRAGEPELACAAILLTGRTRPYDRDRLLRQWMPKIKAGRENPPDHPLFVVATQTVEVGANLDFDALITEAAPLDSLRQRFGRLDRLGTRQLHNLESPAVILIRSDQKSRSDDDMIYGQSISETWKWMDKNSSKRKGKPKQIDFAVNHLDPKLPQTLDQLRPMLAPQPGAPLLFPAHLDAWVQTNPTPDPDPDVAPFLHGQADSAADVQMVWRADLSDDNRDAWAKIVSLMPPRTREALPVPLYAVKAWLQRIAQPEVADFEGVAVEEPVAGQDHVRWALAWWGSGEKNTRPVRWDKIMPGDTIVVPASYGGADEHGWNPAFSGPVNDVADPCLTQLVASYPTDAYRRPKLRLRLHPSLLDAISVDKAANERLKGSLRNAVAVAQVEGADPWPTVRDLLSALIEHVNDPAHVARLQPHQVLQMRLQVATVNALLGAARPQVTLYPEHDGVVVMASVPISLADDRAAPAEDVQHQEPEGDEASLAPAGRQVLLTEHTEGVKKRVTEFAERCGLSNDAREALALAAHWHDEGKRDPRFQAWLQGSELKALAGLAAERPLAKSGRDLDQWGRSDAFGYAQGERHEFVSVRLFQTACKNHSDSGMHDLVSMLIGTHHGYGRAFVPVAAEGRPVEVVVKHDGQRSAVSSDHRLHCLDSRWVDLFWRMVRRYGWWGLAFLEALLVTADRLVSAREQQECALQFRTQCRCFREHQQSRA